LLIVAIFSVLVGGAYALLMKYGLITAEMLQTVKYMFASAIVVYNVLSHFAKKAKKAVANVQPEPESEVPAPEVQPQTNPDQPQV